MGVLHDYECLLHGVFESRAKKPKCPKGCTTVSIVFLQPVGTVSAGTRTSDKLVREMAAMQGLSDLSVSPSRSGGTVMQRLRAKGGKPDLSHLHETQLPKAVDAKQFLGAMTNKSNELSKMGMGNAYNPHEWKKGEDGRVRHTGSIRPNQAVPTGSTGVSIERVKGNP